MSVEDLGFPAWPGGEPNDNGHIWFKVGENWYPREDECDDAITASFGAIRYQP
jgi:hypothetical protein